MLIIGLFLRLRGLCPKSVFDRTFSILNDEKNDKLTYQGTTRSTIVFIGDKWKMTVVGSDAIAVSFSSMASLALGTNLWNVEGDRLCSRMEQQINLTLSTCSAGQFTCGNGHCIPLNQRSACCVFTWKSVFAGVTGVQTALTTRMS